MSKIKFLLAFILLLAVFPVLNAQAKAENAPDTATGSQVQQQTQTKTQLQDASSDANQLQTSNTVQTQNTQQVQQQTQTQNGQKNQTGETAQVRTQAQIMVQTHQSVVAESVQKLLNVADRQSKIGEQIRTAAQEQNKSAETTVKAMEQVQTRSRIRTFFLGADYKNLGTLRSEMVQTRNRLSNLDKLIGEATTEADRAELDAQIQKLEQERAKIESFVKENESQFSLFGWFVKMFNK